MDVMASLLDGPRARGAFLLRSVFDPPWSVRIEDRAPLTLMAMLDGDGWVIPDGGEPVPMPCGTIVVMRGPDPYTVADDPATAPRAVIHPGEISRTPEGAELCETFDLGLRTWGSSIDGRAVLFSGTYQMDGEINRRLLDALPPMVVVSDVGSDPLLRLLTDEVGRDRPGQEVFLDRLLDLLLISVLRDWFARPDAEPPAWYAAHSDPVVGRALRLLHDEPTRGWTVAELSREVGVSRAVLAERFRELVGQPPMSYLTDWRLSLAADLLAQTEDTIGSVARRVGYGSAFALSTAFKRERGLSPQQWRESVRR